MSSPYHSYLSLHQSIDPTEHIVVTFSLKTEGAPFDQTAGGVAAESSVGTWTDVSFEQKSAWKKLHAHVVEADETAGIIKIAYPLELFEPGNLPQLLSSIAGNIFGLKEITTLRLNDIEFPKKYVCSYPGPALGIKGVRKLTGVADCALLGSIIKPKLGLSTIDHAQVALDVFDGGINLVKDDENLTSQTFNNFYDRVTTITAAMKKQHYLTAGSARIYAYNITASYEEMVKRADWVRACGGNCHMVDVLTIGFSGVCGIRNKNYGLMIHGHRAMHAAFTRSRKYGISMLVLAKLSRLAGVDSLHTGTVIGKMEGEKSEVQEINNFLRSEWYGLKTVLPVASGGLHPGHVPDLVKILDSDMLFNFGGGIHGHPDGSKAGAKAVIQALEAVQSDTTLQQYSHDHPELARALEKWMKDDKKR